MALIAFADPELKKNTFEITIPWLAGILSTRSLDKQIPGLNQIIAENKERITQGVVAVKALEQLRKNPNDAQARATFEEHKKDLGFGLLVSRSISPTPIKSRKLRSSRLPMTRFRTPSIPCSTLSVSWPEPVSPFC